MVAPMGMVPLTHLCGCFHSASFMEERRWFCDTKIHEGWVSYIVTIFLIVVDQNAIEDELLQIF
jgi:hypothetical protein